MIAGAAIAAACGALTWTFLEYVIHRWMGHDRRFRRTPFGVEHLRHHVEGDYFTPARRKLVVAVVAIALLSGPAIALVGVSRGLPFVLGLVGLYGVYEWLHRRDHTHAGIGPYGRWLRRHHFRHHLVDARANFGVTSPLWDLVFGTYRGDPAVIPVPPRLRMRWLVDPDTGVIDPAHAATFPLRTRE